jgi:tetraacyldisaccharide 4'-kinase
MKTLLKLLKPLYLFLTTADRLLHRLLSFLVYRAPVKVISIGNLTTGGTGKTPVLFELTKELLTQNPCVISRGYRCPWENSFYLLKGKGPHPQQLTDEALLFNRYFPEVPLLLGKRRDNSARYATRHLKPGLLILDDAFQHRRLAKDFELFLWDAMSIPEEAELLPAGKLREPLSRIRQANVILLTRCESADARQVSYWQKRLQQIAPGIRIVKMKTLSCGLFNSNEEKVAPQNYPKNAIAFSALGRPKSFISQLGKSNINISQSVEFRDHHLFTTSDFARLAELSRQKQLPLICSEKDLVKIPPQELTKLKVFYLRIRVVPVSGRSLLTELQEAGFEI